MVYRRLSLTRPFSTNARLDCKYTFFTDIDLGDIIPDALKQIGLTVERHKDHFEGPTRDPVWLAEVGKRGWVALTHDKGQRRRPDEIHAIMTSGLADFILIGKNHNVVADNLVKSIRRVIAFRDKHEAPFIAKLCLPDASARDHAERSGGTAKGRVEMSLSYSEWRSDRP
jgi:PIN domain-containing protein